jgi:pimeloyl-ACP methyl ester carboxylesterase
MLTQIRYAVSQYKKNGGKVRELKVSNSGHTPFLEKPEIVWQALRRFLNEHSKSVSAEGS